MDRKNIVARAVAIFSSSYAKLKQLNKTYHLPLIFLLISIVITGVGSWFYLDTPELNLQMVSGTEYISGEQGQLIVRLTTYDGAPVTDASCQASVLYPNKSPFLTDQLMSQSTESGNYYYVFTPPSEPGIYEYTITCVYSVNGRSATSSVSHSFHVSPALIAMLAQLNETRIELEAAKNELHLYLLAINQSLDESISTKIAEESFERDQKMSNLGQAISDVFAT
jgi:hypothetical protein